MFISLDSLDSRELVDSRFRTQESKGCEENGRVDVRV